jgi:molybdenum cofactor cytidylyltransferase
VWVVTGADESVGPAARAFAADRGESSRLVTVHAADHAKGQAASLRAGIAALPADTAAAFIFLGDMPRIPHDIPGRLILALRDGAAASAPMFEGVRGHPVLIAAELFPALADLTGDQGARAVLASLGPRLALVETNEPGVLIDIDAPGDLGER